MLDSGYLFAKDEKRLFINTCLGCVGKCSYCYLPKIGYSNKEKSDKIMFSEEIIEYLDKSDYKLSSETLITFGCFSECWDEKNKDETLKLIKYFLSKGNQIQLSTKKFIIEKDISEIIPLIKYVGQFTIFISASTISHHDDFESNTSPINDRFKSFKLLNKNIPVVLYIKPVIKNITIKDITLFNRYIEKYNIKDVVVGSIFTESKSNESVHFSSKNKLFYNSIDDEETIIKELSKNCSVYRRSTEVTMYYKSVYGIN